MKAVVGGVATVAAVVVVVYLFGQFGQSYKESTGPQARGSIEDARAECLDRLEHDKAKLRGLIDEMKTQIRDLELDRTTKSDGEKLTDAHKEFLLEGHERRLSDLERRYEELTPASCQSEGIEVR